MTFDLAALRQAVAEHQQVVRVVVAKVDGSAPREVGAAMLVSKDGQTGTIGGGALEWQAVSVARTLTSGHPKLARYPLGPALGQCCGGAVTLVYDYFDQQAVDVLGDDIFARRISGDSDPSLSVQKSLALVRSGNLSIKPHIVDGWMIEGISRPSRPIWVFGAGHVGRALVNILSPLPDVDLTWIDIADTKFPRAVPDTVTKIIAANPADLLQYAPQNTDHIVVTYSHSLDLELCHRALLHGFASLGLIGSKSKWSRFQKRLRDLGHSSESIHKIMCPIGQPKFGKHPHAIAIGVASEMMARSQEQDQSKEMAG